MSELRRPSPPQGTLFPGPAGAIEAFVDAPAQARGVAIVAHPHPLLGGSAHHKVPFVLARALQARGWLAVRPNFRGVGASAGVHDEGAGETEDLLALVNGLRAQHPGLPLALVGFSFGAFVQARVAVRLAAAGVPADRLVLTGFPVGAVDGGRCYEPHPDTPEALIVHGEHDERVALSAVLAWARCGPRPVVVIPGVDHFFTGRLPVLRALVERYCG